MCFRDVPRQARVCKPTAAATTEYQSQNNRSQAQQHRRIAEPVVRRILMLLINDSNCTSVCTGDRNQAQALVWHAHGAYG